MKDLCYHSKMKLIEHRMKNAMPTVEIEDYVLIVSKSVFYIPIKNKEEAYEKIIEIKKSGYATDNLLNYDYFSGY